jgi:hypothetical protein
MNVFLSVVACEDPSTQVVVTSTTEAAFLTSDEAEAFVQANPPQFWTTTDSTGKQLACARGVVNENINVFLVVVACEDPVSQAVVSSAAEAVFLTSDAAEAYVQANPPQTWTTADSNGKQLVCARGVVNA